jgi:Bacteriophage head to tail connecting protein
MAASPEVQEIKRKLKIAREKRTPWESPYQDCYDFALPGRSGFSTRSPGNSTAPEIFDETAVVGVQEFASRIQAGLIPNYSRWADLVAGPEIEEDKRSEVNKALEVITEYVFEILNNSNFAQEANETLIDIALGTACLEVEEGDATTPIIFTAVPLPELLLDAGPDDRLDHIFRCRSVRFSLLEQAFPGCKVPADLNKSHNKDNDPLLEVVECVYRDYDNKAAETYEYEVLLPASDDIIKSETYSGIGSCPYIAFRWSKVAGEVWGRGPLLNTMPAVKTANMVVQMVLENAQLAIAGIYTAEDDGVLNPANIRLVPGTIIPISPGSSGLKSIGSAGDFNVSQLVLSDMRQNIKKALFNDTLGPTDKTPMSATEVSQRMADLSRQIGSAFGRLQSEFVNRVLQRVVHILKKQGRITLPRVDGHEIKINAASPLSRAQDFEDVQRVQQFCSAIAAIYGPQMVNLYTDGAETAKYLQGKYGVPEKIVRNDQQRAELAQQMSQLQESAAPPMEGAMNGAGIGA